MKPFDTSRLYVLSGTGNTFRVACWIEDYLKTSEIKTAVKFIEHVELKEEFESFERQLAVVMFPTHGFMPPWSMIKFLFKMPRQKNAKILSIATRGALWFGPVKIPGAAGFANFFAALILLFKGYDIIGFFSLDMASNFNNFHPSLTHDAITGICNKSKNKVTAFMARVVEGKRVLFTLNNLYEAIWTSLLFWLIPLFPILYLIYAKTSMAKMMFASNKCTSCGMCAKICPNNAIEMKKFLGQKRPFWTYHCENCMRCLGYCKEKAVEAGHSWILLFTFILSVPVLASLAKSFTHVVGNFLGVQNYWLVSLIEALYYVPVLLLSYWLFWMLIRIPFANTIFSVTTLTHYFKRFHDPETKIGSLIKKGKNNPE
ncbi:MAG: 4Fe-4S dicluster domain-containing protein [Desulfobacterales bacterium]|nr:4Fe-4S dicluster domain-containing protein [Desulfobacterales bacterium]